MKANSSTISLAILALAIVLYVGVVSPMSGTILKTRTQLSEKELRLTTIEASNGQREEIKKRIAALEKANEEQRGTWITPMLNSYSMRVKALIDAMATESGLVNIEYGEAGLRALPVPKERVPDNRTARRCVRVKAMADYAAAVSFMMRLEKEMPLVSVQSVSMHPTQDQQVERQEVEYILEWPGEGEVIK